MYYIKIKNKIGFFGINYYPHASLQGSITLDLLLSQDQITLKRLLSLALIPLLLNIINLSIIQRLSFQYLLSLPHRQKKRCVFCT